ncbi:MAG: 2-oxo-hepta-3-ene-1,7-dioic acid hydratase [Rhodobacteraceae bacterium]|nr:2-oxo-hepta-3-ene-1,7-dioic acid hydratase [Paracoccaceae bacterium]
MSEPEISRAADDLFMADQKGHQIGLLSLRHPQMNMDDAYRVQKALARRIAASGKRVVGWKIGLTSKAMQQALNIDIPDSGVLFDHMVFKDGGTVPAGRFIQPRIEAEIAFVMKTDLSGGNITRKAVIAATDYVAPALEILDTRILRQDPDTGRVRNVFDTIADNAANAGLVLGGQKHDLSAVDLRWVGAILQRNGEVEETGLGAGVLNDPVTSVAWLANRLHEYGDTIRAGDIILSGSFIRPVEASPGSRFSCDYGDFGGVAISFE